MLLVCLVNFTSDKVKKVIINNTLIQTNIIRKTVIYLHFDVRSRLTDYLTFTLHLHITKECHVGMFRFSDVHSGMSTLPSPPSVYPSNSHAAS